ncbi:MAG: hypothetical protein UT86_C0006G0008 [Candidatus Magasanikbacteria bacterium GW2011_GWC2_40_17]|uniref:Uncharacterized protein n=1 Tax=Candidatus Magasanikbacteria bacterium GW2011_GWA2_42_32 TaxID=1619039 RepID=A0A0G1A6F5_9BACT|nr:MAG: hypothetical protein UT86_C0006G0008 [Candidatus Magasanikbacteria bacterium GW2011_GWC2_40_17]KKS56632.1 MAG: hypothetical protein UV20_C0008G0008 [Candidatus Magasanikbacteria bacterium GW2011_GWA2_42_32]
MGKQIKKRQNKKNRRGKAPAELALETKLFPLPIGILGKHPIKDS